MNSISPLDQDYELKMISFESECNDLKGDVGACHHVGEFFTVMKSDYERASKVYSINCKRGYAPSCFNLGRFYLTGKGAVQDDFKAKELFDIACKDKHWPACFHSGIIGYSGEEYKDGKKIADENVTIVSEANRVKALKAFEDACLLGDEVHSCNTIGSHYLRMDDKNRNPLKAQHYLTKGCELNHGPSCFNLAVMYKNGDTGVPKDEQKFNEYKKKTDGLVQQYGSLSGVKIS